MAALIAEATNLGLSRMAEMCGTVARRALLRMQTWHMREDTYRAALASMTDAIHAEPLSVWFGEGWRASADGQAYYLGGPGEAGGSINGHYGRDPIVKIYTTITDRYAPLHQKVIAGTPGEAIHASLVKNCLRPAPSSSTCRNGLTGWCPLAAGRRSVEKVLITGMRWKLVAGKLPPQIASASQAPGDHDNCRR